MKRLMQMCGRVITWHRRILCLYPSTKSSVTQNRLKHHIDKDLFLILCHRRFFRIQKNTSMPRLAVVFFLSLAGMECRGQSPGTDAEGAEASAKIVVAAKEDRGLDFDAVIERIKREMDEEKKKGQKGGWLDGYLLSKALQPRRNQLSIRRRLSDAIVPIMGFFPVRLAYSFNGRTLIMAQHISDNR